MSLPPGAGTGAPAEALPEPLPRWERVGLPWLGSKGRRWPSRPRRGRRLTGEERKVQPGLLALQMLGRVSGDVVIPEAAGTETDTQPRPPGSALRRERRPQGERWVQGRLAEAGVIDQWGHPPPDFHPVVLPESW